MMRDVALLSRNAKGRTAMRIVFDPDFEYGSWPGALRGRPASAGEDWLGPSRLAQVLEQSLGLNAPRTTLTERTARLVPAVCASDGFWSVSAAVDPFATARRLLQWRDTMAMGGWRGEGTQPRLAALAALMVDCAPGLPDRLWAINGELARRSPGIESVELFLPRSDLEPLWQQTLSLLEQRGTRVLHTQLAASVPLPGTDLAGARSQRFNPTGDGTVRLLRPAGPLAAAEEVAAWLACLGNPPETLIVGGDPVLDAALHRHGLPTTGAIHDLPETAVLQILPLALDLGWMPQDPQRAYELLSLPAGPVPGAVAGRLRNALAQWPAVDSDAWRQALTEGLDLIEDADRRSRVKQRLDVLWDARVPRTGAYPTTEVTRRATVLREWLLKRAALDDTNASAWRAGASQCEVVLALVQRSGVVELSAAQLRHLVIEATRDVAGEAPFVPQAGLNAVGTPGGVAGPASIIVWWRFNWSAVTGVERLPLTRAERDELRNVGVTLREAAQIAAALARGWRRPLEQARERLLLVCPEKDGAGEELHPHPLWDELVARVDAERNRRRVAERALLAASLHDAVPRRRRDLLPLPAPKPGWLVDAGPIERRSQESPSSVEKFLQCPFQWVVEYVAKLHAPDAVQVDDGTNPRVLGDLLHAIMNRLFAGPHREPEEAAIEAGNIFDREAPRLVAALFLPGADTQRERVRRAAVRTAETLYALMASGGLRVETTEQDLAGEAFGTRFGGRVDLVLGPPARVLDLKWSGANSKRQALKGGSAIQLAAYAFLERQGQGVFPPVGYFVMDLQRLLTTEQQAFPGAEQVDGPSPQDTWQALTTTHASQWQGVAEGHVDAPGAGMTPKERARKGHVENGRLIVPLACRWCDYTTLCGLAFEEEA